MFDRRRLLKTAALAPLATVIPAASLAQAYPNKPIRMVVPFPPAGATDILARLVGHRLTEAFGQQVVVDNRPGAGGNLGTEHVVKSPADGYTLLMGTIANTINHSLHKNLPFDFGKDVAPVAMTGLVSNVMVVHPDVPAKSPSEFIAWVKANPGKVNFASSGNGTSIHMSGELFKIATGADMTHIPYRGSGPAVADLTSGQVQVMFDNLPSALPHIRAGKLRALAVTSPKRAKQLPDVPTLAEAGVPGVEAVAWFAVVAPAATPKDVIAKLNVEILKAMGHPDIISRLDDIGAEPRAMTPDELGAFIKGEIDKWGKVVKASGAKVD
ncbi:MAG: tripartite tricarboxylate transporter substrate binding protein [Alphaproteobacteria bacterium]|nr:tripartite tricarboxylate transporter substrate binding protein [Alphaproteobacteria bacterium]